MNRHPNKYESYILYDFNFDEGPSSRILDEGPSSRILDEGPKGDWAERSDSSRILDDIIILPSKFKRSRLLCEEPSISDDIILNISENEEKINIKNIQQLKEMSIIDRIYEFVCLIQDERIFLLKNKNVIMWLFGDLSFLSPIEKKNKTLDVKKYKILEDKWGQDTLKYRRPDLKLDKQWTNKFGEHLCEELYIILKKNICKPIKKYNYQPDFEIDDEIIEVKTGTYYTAGTAGEKILGCPFKYSEIPDLYLKPLKILCIGGAEKICREQYGNLPGEKCSLKKKEYLDFFKKNKIEYIGATDILKTLINL
jgi:hypothetical protein